MAGSTGKRKLTMQITGCKSSRLADREAFGRRVNREKALALIENKQMKPAGLQAVKHAKQTGRWDAAYASQSKMVVPEDLQEALNKNKRAKAFFATLDSANRYAILFRLHHAKKAETRLTRLHQFVSMLEKGEKIHP